MGAALRLGLGVAAAAVAGSLAYCNVYTPDLVAGPAAPDAGNGIGFWSGPGSAGCFSAKSPSPADRPASADPSELPAIYLAIRELRMGSRDANGMPDQNAWQDLGMDLDNVCTSSPTCDTTDPIVSCKPTGASVPVDGNYCRDNTFGKLEGYASTIPEVGGKYGLNDEAFNCALCRGDYNFIIRITQYNGKENDDHVRVDFYPSPGLVTPLPWDCTSSDWRAHPCFTSDAPWYVSDDGVGLPQGGPDLPDAVVYDADGFVKNGYIVVQLPADALFWFPGKRAVATAFPVKFAQAVVAGHFHKASDGTWAIDDGTIAGRTRRDDVIHAFRLIGFCESDPNYTIMQNFLNASLDLLADGTNDPNTPCDAISVGIGFSAVQSVAGGLQHVDPLVECQPKDAGADAPSDSGSDAGADAPSDAPADATGD